MTRPYHRLTEDEQRIIIARHALGYSGAAIARDLHLPRDTVLAAIRRFRREGRLVPPVKPIPRLTVAKSSPPPPGLLGLVSGVIVASVREAWARYRAGRPAS